MVRRLDAFNAAVLKRKTSVYIALAGLPRQKEAALLANENAIARFAQAMSSKASPLLRFQLQAFENGDHLSVPLIGAYHGLTFAFEGYRK